MPHLIDGLCLCALMWEGRHEFPPVSGMAIKQMLALLEIGTLARGEGCDFVVMQRDHGAHPFPGYACGMGIATLEVLEEACVPIPVAVASHKTQKA